MEKDRGILADAVEQDRVAEGRRGLAVDVQRLGLEFVEDGVVRDGALGGGGRHRSAPSVIERPGWGAAYMHTAAAAATFKDSAPP